MRRLARHKGDKPWQPLGKLAISDPATRVVHQPDIRQTGAAKATYSSSRVAIPPWPCLPDRL